MGKKGTLNPAVKNPTEGRPGGRRRTNAGASINNGRKHGTNKGGLGVQRDYWPTMREEK